MPRTTDELLKDAEFYVRTQLKGLGTRDRDPEYLILIAELSAKLRESERIIDFMQTWVRRINSKETTPEEFISVVSHHPSLKESTPPKKEKTDA